MWCDGPVASRSISKTSTCLDAVRPPSSLTKRTIVFRKVSPSKYTVETKTSPGSRLHRDPRGTQLSGPCRRRLIGRKVEDAIGIGPDGAVTTDRLDGPAVFRHVRIWGIAHRGRVRDHGNLGGKVQPARDEFRAKAWRDPPRVLGDAHQGEQGRFGLALIERDVVTLKVKVALGRGGGVQVAALRQPHER